MDASAAPRDAPVHGRVIACFGRRSLVELDGGIDISCVARGRRSGIVCGDNVRITLASAGEGVIEDVDPRACLIYRSDSKREKAIAANVTQVVVVLAVAPVPNRDFVDRCLVAAEHAEARTLLVLNKTDLVDQAEQARHAVELYAALGYRTVPVSKFASIDLLVAELEGHLSLLIGQSGVGKSTLVNRLVPEAKARVGELSHARHAGRHTTTRAELYRIDARTALIDSPGMHAFGLHHVSPADLADGFSEFRAFLGSCRFANCRHDGEPGCALEEAVRDDRIQEARLASYRRILKSIA